MTDVPTRMSRTDEVHRITENVYKVRRTVWGAALCVLPPRRWHLLLRRGGWTPTHTHIHTCPRCRAVLEWGVCCVTLRSACALVDRSGDLKVRAALKSAGADESCCCHMKRDAGIWCVLDQHCLIWCFIFKLCLQLLAMGDSTGGWRCTHWWGEGLLWERRDWICSFVGFLCVFNALTSVCGLGCVTVSHLEVYLIPPRRSVCRVSWDSIDWRKKGKNSKVTPLGIMYSAILFTRDLLHL